MRSSPALPAPPAPPAPPPAAGWGTQVLRWPALLVWALAAGALALLDGHVELADLALLLVLAGALASLWLPLTEALLLDVLAVVGFVSAFVPPRGGLRVDVRGHGALLVTLLVVSGLVSMLMARQRRLALAARAQTAQVTRLAALAERLRATDDPRQCAEAIDAALAACCEGPVTLLLRAQAGPLPAVNDPAAVQQLGPAGADELAGLWQALRHAQAYGPGTGRHDELAGWTLPMRGRGASYGAALLRSPPSGRHVADPLAHAQAVCDQVGLALERNGALRAAQQARDAAQAQAVSNAFLAAISHDYRTPLAIILGAASSLHDQAGRLEPAARRQLAARIVEECGHLTQMTDNLLQLARLDAPGSAPRLDWESVEEIVGAVLRRARDAHPARLLRTRVAPGLPLLRCDALLLSQLLANLVDNALKYGDPDQPVELVAELAPPPRRQLLLAVEDRGAGVPEAERQRIFEIFHRADHGPDADGQPRRGAGVGLAVCRAIARAHGGELLMRPRSGGGSRFECQLPLPAQAAPAPLPAFHRPSASP